MNLYIFNNKSRGGLYGVGTYVRELVTALRGSGICIHVVHLLCNQSQIERKEIEGISYWYFPEPVSKEWHPLDQEQRKVYSRNIVYLLRYYIKEVEDVRRRALTIRYGVTSLPYPDNRFCIKKYVGAWLVFHQKSWYDHHVINHHLMVLDELRMDRCRLWYVKFRWT